MPSISLSRLPIASPALFLGGLLWVAAFWLPVFETPERTIVGYWVFITGWMGFAMFQFAWYANLLMLMAVIMMYTAPLRATILAAAGLLVATQAFWFDVLPGTTSSTKITGQGLGFWCWYGSIFLLGLGVVFGSDESSIDETVRSKTPRKTVSNSIKHNEQQGTQSAAKGSSNRSDSTDPDPWSQKR